MLSCKQASQLISQSLDRKLTTGERFALKFHLFICKYCKNFSQQLQTIRVALKASLSAIENDSTIEMPRQAKNRIATLVETNPVQP
jgi:Putative zinc-finger